MGSMQLKHGLKYITVEEAIAKADIIMILLPDE